MQSWLSNTLVKNEVLKSEVLKNEVLKSEVLTSEVVTSEVLKNDEVVEEGIACNMCLCGVKRGLRMPLPLECLKNEGMVVV